jgi:hypothetical protein
MACFYCDKTTDLRPYGPDGADICHKCATATPERRAAAEAEMERYINAIDGPIIIRPGGPPQSLAQAMAESHKKADVH